MAAKLFKYLSRVFDPNAYMRKDIIFKPFNDYLEITDNLGTSICGFYRMEMLNYNIRNDRLSILLKVDAAFALDIGSFTSKVLTIGDQGSDISREKCQKITEILEAWGIQSLNKITI